MNINTTCSVLQMIVTELREGAFVHKVQGQLFKSQGFAKLGQKYIDHYAEEMEWVEKCANRMLDLGCVPQVQATKERAAVADPKAYIEADLQIQREGVQSLYQIMPTLASDPTTYDLLKAYLADEEEDLYWSEEQLELIAMIGIQNWLVKQM